MAKGGQLSASLTGNVFVQFVRTPQLDLLAFVNSFCMMILASHWVLRAKEVGIVLVQTGVQSRDLMNWNFQPKRMLGLLSETVPPIHASKLKHVVSLLTE